jgi:hypothetical protein
MRFMTDNALLVRVMDGSGIQNLASMAAQTVFIYRLYAIMRLVTLVTVQPSHGDLVGERCPPRLPVTAQAAFPVGNEHAGFFRRKRMTQDAWSFLHTRAMDLPVLVTAKTGILFRPEGMDRPLMAVPACKLFHIDMPGVTR